MMDYSSWMNSNGGTKTKLEPYKVGKEAEYWQYLWYDKKSKTAFYEEYSL